MWNQPKIKSKKIFLEFKGLSPNEIGEGSDLTVRGIPSGRAPVRQRWTFPSHTIISALHLSSILSLTRTLSHTHEHRYLHSFPAGQVLCRKLRVLPGNNASPWPFSYLSDCLISAGSAFSWVRARPRYD